MYQIDNKQFGMFTAQLRREKNMTQKELGERLFVSDKTVSKWERGLSMPNVSLLIPMAEILGVTVTELLRGSRICENVSMDIREVERLVTCSVDMSLKEREQDRKQKKKWIFIYGVSVLLIAAEMVLLWLNGFLNESGNSVFLVEGLMILFGAWVCIFIKETLPGYYDEHKISFVSDGVFRMNIPGIHLNNSNWPHIVKWLRIDILTIGLLFPAGYFIAQKILGRDGIGQTGPVFLLVLLIGIFVPIYYVGKRYE